MLCGAALSGCTSTSTVAPAPGFAGPATVAETQVASSDAGFALALPESVSVLPEPSGVPSVQTAALAATPAAFAGPTPQGAAAAAQQVAALAPAPATESSGIAAAAQSSAGSGEVSPVAATPAKASTVTASDAVAAKPDPMRIFPAAPVLVASAAATLPVTPIAYSGPVPSYLAPAVFKIESPSADLPRTPVRGRSDVEKLITKYAALYEVPVELVRHVVNRESTFNPKAYNNGHWGLMQIKHATGRGMGYSGPASGLFDAETNLRYAVKYLRGAWLVSDRNAKRADWLYQTGYYYEAKRKGLLEATGLGIDRKRRRAVEEEVRLDPEGIVRPPVLPVGSSG